MPGLPRCICMSCGNDIAARKNGTPREHHVRWEMTPSGKQRLVITHANLGKVCKGSGKPARPR
jgi:hypothetical protein